MDDGTFPPDVLARRWELVAAHRARLLRIAGSRAGNPVDAEDVVQEAMVRCVAYADLDEARIGSFLTTLTLRLCVDQHRQRARELRSGTAVFHGEVAGPGPEDVVCDRAEAAWATEVAAKLPERQWEALTFVARGADVAETARRMHLSYKAVESALSRARSVVRLRLVSTLAALACFARRGRTLAVPVTTVAVAGVAAVVIGPAGRPLAPQTDLPWRAAAPVVREADREPVAAPAPAGTPRQATAPVARQAVRPRPAPRPRAPRPAEEPDVVIPVPGRPPVQITHRETEDTLDRQLERCATSYHVYEDEEGDLQSGCEKQPGDPGAYPVSDLIESNWPVD